MTPAEILYQLQHHDLSELKVSELIQVELFNSIELLSFEQFLLLKTIMLEHYPSCLATLYGLHPLLRSNPIGGPEDLHIILADPLISITKKFNYCVKYLRQNFPIPLVEYHFIYDHAYAEKWGKLLLNYLEKVHPQRLEFQVARNVLGLTEKTKELSEGLFPGIHLPATQYRWRQLKASQSLPLYGLTEFADIAPILMKAATFDHGDWLSLCFRADESRLESYIRTTIEQSSHVATLHLIRDRDKAQMLWLNRGYKPSQANFFHQRHLWIFTLSYDKALELLPQLLEILVRGPIELIQTSLDSMLSTYLNRDYSFQLFKTAQKVGNCGLANTNITWHLSLCAALMKKEHLDFITSYVNTKNAYKELRAQDQINALKLILDHEAQYKSPAVFHQDIFEILVKFYRKDEISLSFLQTTIHHLGAQLEKLANYLSQVDVSGLKTQALMLSGSNLELLSQYVDIKDRIGEAAADEFLSQQPSCDNHHHLLKVIHAQEKPPAAIIKTWQEHLSPY